MPLKDVLEGVQLVEVNHFVLESLPDFCQMSELRKDFCAGDVQSSGETPLQLGEVSGKKFLFVFRAKNVIGFVTAIDPGPAWRLVRFLAVRPQR